MNDDGTAFPDECDYCGTPFEIGVRYPAFTEDGPDGEFDIYTFCDDECKSEWLDERDEAASQ